MAIDDMNTMDVDTDYEPTVSAMPAVDAREPCHKPSLGDDASVVDRSPANMFDRERDPQHGRPKIGQEKRPGAFKINCSKQACTRCVHINEDYNTYHEVAAYKYVYGKSVTQFVLGKNNSMILLNATDVVSTRCPAKMEIEKPPPHD